VHLDHYYGSPLSGPQLPIPADLATADVLPVSITFIGLGQMPSSLAQPLPARARILAAPGGDSPLLPAPLLTQRARVTDVPDSKAFLAALRRQTSGPSIVLGQAHTAIPAGVTASLEITDRPLPNAPGGSTRHLSVAVYYPAAPATPAATRETAPPPIQIALALDETPQSGREIALIDCPASPAGAVALGVPFVLPDSPVHAVVAVVEVAPIASGSGYQAALRQCLSDVNSWSGPSGGAGPGADSIADWPALAAAVQALGLPDNRRAALVFLADQSGADITKDLALVANDQMLASLAWAVLHGTQSAPSARPKRQIAWLLDRQSLALLTNPKVPGSTAPEMVAILIRHTGQCARQPDSIAEAMQGAVGVADLQNRLVAENMIFLEDVSPASRVRAYDWLARCGRAPAGYDPLAPARQRLDALDRASSAAPAGGGSGPLP
jgi:hypothetical protein